MSESETEAAEFDSSSPDLTERRWARMREIIARRLDSLTIILDHLHDPHNISAVVRSCEAFGIQRVHVVRPGEMPEINPLVSIRSERWLEVIHHEDLEECLCQVKGKGYRLYAADVNPESENLENLDFSGPVALVLGAEHHGLSDVSRKAADAFYHIEMQGFTESFNVSVAAALSIYISSRLRRNELGCAGDFTAEEQEQIVRQWALDQRERRSKKYER